MSPDADVLVVDDDNDVRSSVAAILRHAGYEVEEAADGVEALELLRNNRVGTVLLDLRMPRCDGFAVMRSLEDPPPIVIVSAHNVDDAERARLGPEVVAILKKPVPPITLLDQVALVLSHQEAQ